MNTRLENLISQKAHSVTKEFTFHPLIHRPNFYPLSAFSSANFIISKKVANSPRHTATRPAIHHSIFLFNHFAGVLWIKSFFSSFPPAVANKVVYFSST